MYYEELYEKAYSGDLSALKELESEAGTGNAEAQYVLSCVYDNVTRLWSLWMVGNSCTHYRSNWSLISLI